MLVGVVHKITDAAAWRDRTAQVESGGPPEGFKLPVSVHSAAGDYAFCLWDVPSEEALRAQLDPMTEGASTNTYFDIDTQHPATNIPASEATAAR